MVYASEVAHLGVLRLEHALDAKEVLEAGVRFLVAQAPRMEAGNAIAWADFAERCGVDALLAAAGARLAELVRAAGNEGASSALAARILRECSTRLIVAVARAAAPVNLFARAEAPVNMFAAQAHLRPVIGPDDVLAGLFWGVAGLVFMIGGMA